MGWRLRGFGLGDRFIWGIKGSMVKSGLQNSWGNMRAKKRWANREIWEKSIRGTTIRSSAAGGLRWGLHSLMFLHLPAWTKSRILQ
jgi:hypothetical protein